MVGDFICLTARLRCQSLRTPSWENKASSNCLCDHHRCKKRQGEARRRSSEKTEASRSVPNMHTVSPVAGVTGSESLCDNWGHNRRIKQREPLIRSLRPQPLAECVESFQNRLSCTVSAALISDGYYHSSLSIGDIFGCLLSQFAPNISHNHRSIKKGNHLFKFLQTAFSANSFSLI